MWIDWRWRFYCSFWDWRSENINFCWESIALAKEWACAKQVDGYANIYDLDFNGLNVLNLNDGHYNILNWLALLADNRTYWQNGSIAEEAKSYIKENKESIINISISIAEQVLREKFKDIKLMEAMLNNIIAEYDLKKDLVIKVNPLYKEELQKNIDEEISKNNLSQKIFIIPDLGVKEGNAVIETESGKLIVGIDSVLDKVKEELL